MAWETVSSGITAEVVGGATQAVMTSSAGVVCCGAASSINSGDAGAVDELRALTKCSGERLDDGEKRYDGENEVEKHLELEFVSLMN
jgi:hypothetical protein